MMSDRNAKRLKRTLAVLSGVAMGAFIASLPLRSALAFGAAYVCVMLYILLEICSHDSEQER